METELDDEAAPSLIVESIRHALGPEGPDQIFDDSIVPAICVQEKSRRDRKTQTGLFLLFYLVLASLLSLASLPVDSMRISLTVLGLLCAESIREEAKSRELCEILQLH